MMQFTIAAIRERQEQAEECLLNYFTGRATDEEMETRGLALRKQKIQQRRLHHAFHVLAVLAHADRISRESVEN